MSKTNFVERNLERGLFASRWLMAPFLCRSGDRARSAACRVLARHCGPRSPTSPPSTKQKVILWVLTLIDLSLAANLIVMVIFAGYENFVSKMDIGGHPDRPMWMGTIDFSAMKLKLVASIVAISAIHLLKAFMSLESYSREQLIFLTVIHITFVVSGVLLALMDYIADKAGEHQH
jgi:uncharacterized protein (TIGR00645 family)